MKKFLHAITACIILLLIIGIMFGVSYGCAHKQIVPDGAPLCKADFKFYYDNGEIFKDPEETLNMGSNWPEDNGYRCVFGSDGMTARRISTASTIEDVRKAYANTNYTEEKKESTDSASATIISPLITITVSDGEYILRFTFWRNNTVHEIEIWPKGAYDASETENNRLN